MPFKETKEGQTHSWNDGCGDKNHNCLCVGEESCALCNEDKLEPMPESNQNGENYKTLR